ncbi:hypothetical protein [Flammeovirga sp. SJP92]|uniref:hypothetical protein n=1 Tax=Flammeovirga sp. SJP92 TaxID=1775430 RepID=UPI0007899027|nr:hypothetical protein [Flammeovirga sp. SJP92]KXX69951.1 hypothetical protein AVL50_13830 [Flammeovirga sp. SJP92]
MKAKNLMQFIPLGIVTLLSILYFLEINLTMYQDETITKGSHLSINIKYLLAITGVSITYLLLFLKIDYWKHVFAVVLMTSIFQLTQFYSFTFYVSFIDISSLALFIFHLSANKNLMDNFRSFHKKSEEEIVESNEFQIQFFEKKYNQVHSDELKLIIHQNTMVPEAIEAARRLIQKRRQERKLVEENQ